MKYELKEFQKKAADELLGNMTFLMDAYESHDKLGSCCLAAPTGSGKTVIAAAVIEAILEGSHGISAKPDPDACILWVTDLPSLADQTRERLMDASDLDPSRIEAITNTFTANHTQLERGQVYFLHRQLLGRNRKLTGTGESLSFWQLLRDTIASGIHLYLFLDEAHRGLGSEVNTSKRAQNTDKTIYSQIIDGENGDAPMPVVVGVSATPKRFLQAMANRKGRTTEAPTTVEPADVQASGLLKDDIVLRAPIKVSGADAIYLDEACKALKRSTNEWTGWCAVNQVTPVVTPLMVVQVEDKVSDKVLAQLVKDIRTLLPAIGSDAFAHVFGDHEDRHVGGIEVPYISPESVEGERNIRVLFAKEAISTGWDCPRAEVIFSMRPHRDITYITQLLGRMVRTPLAMRIDDNEELNAVRCYLPRFDEKSVKKVVDYLTSEDSADWSGISAESGRRVYVDPVDVVWDHDLGIDSAFKSIRRVVESHHPTDEITAALEYASLLAHYEVDTTQQKAVRQTLLKTLRNDMLRFKKAYDAAYKDVSTVSSREWHVRYLDADSAKSSDLTQAADAFAIANARKRADAVFTETLTNRFFTSERARHKTDLETNMVIAAAADVPEIVDHVRKVARNELNRMVMFFKSQVDDLPSPARTRFTSVLSANGIHRIENLRILENGLQERENNTRYVYHALSEASSGDAWLDMLPIEAKVIAREQQRDDFVAFYRNPSNGAGEHVLSIVYQHPQGGHRGMHPDFIFFEWCDGRVMPSIVDPHGTHLEDARAKLEGLAKYAIEFGGDFARIWAVNGDGSRYLDMLDKAVQDAFIGTQQSVDDIYKKLGFTYIAE